MTQFVRTRADYVAARDRLRGSVGLVATMGALHDGHAALLAAARSANDAVVATVFVNPLQFGPNEDLDRYPRTLEADVERCRSAGVDLVWAPSVPDMYLGGAVQVSVRGGPLAAILEGAVRPGHFDGMLTVVAKLLNLIRPVRAYFGEKDYQQLTLVRRMVLDLDLGAEIVGVPTVREPDGLALSSRNVFLSPDERITATALSRALAAGVAAGGAGAGGGGVLAAADQVLAAAGVHPDYLVLRAPDLGEAPEQGPARLLVAARVGQPRLIDNEAVTL